MMIGKLSREKIFAFDCPGGAQNCGKVGLKGILGQYCGLLRACFNQFDGIRILEFAVGNVKCVRFCTASNLVCWA